MGDMKTVSTLRFLASMCIACSLLCFVGCKKAPELRELKGSALGTQFSITVRLPDDERAFDLEQLTRDVSRILADVDGKMSSYKADSDVVRFNTQAEIDRWFDVSQETAEVISLAQTVSEKTNGAFDITVGSAVALWGFGAAYNPLRADELPDQAAIEASRATLGYQYLEVQLSPPCLRKHRALEIDLSAIAKGYVVDRLGEHLRLVGLENYLVEVGGELRASGFKSENKPWIVGIESPASSTTRRPIKALSLLNVAVATSGDYRNYYEHDGLRYSHTIDPATGQPVHNNLASVTVVDQNAARADAFATALMAMGFERAFDYAEAHNVAAYFIVREQNAFREQASTRLLPYLLDDNPAKALAEQRASLQ